MNIDSITALGKAKSYGIYDSWTEEIEIMDTFWKWDDETTTQSFGGGTGKFFEAYGHAHIGLPFIDVNRGVEPVPDKGPWTEYSVRFCQMTWQDGTLTIKGNRRSDNRGYTLKVVFVPDN
ncbi:MAG: hypothetical protein AB7E51_18840 [Pseudodesulfovibrio sp.]|uniref:hypothetical protein n=1 Tax=Pseudodesulfovibrio sp. TaxID=2035812 RepID=UPI003D0ABDD0